MRIRKYAGASMQGVFGSFGRQLGAHSKLRIDQDLDFTRRCRERVEGQRRLRKRPATGNQPGDLVGLITYQS